VLTAESSTKPWIQSASEGDGDKKPGNSRVGWWLVLAPLLIGVAFLFDDPVSRLMDVSGMPHLQWFARAMSKIGEGWFIAVVGLAAAGVLGWRRRFEVARWVVVVAMVGLATGGTATVFRSLIGRTRPNAHVEQGVYGPYHNSQWIVGSYDYSSFPSGHTATVVGLAAAVWFFSRRFGFLAAAYAVLVSWSRIAQGSHHFSDVVAASLLGIFGAHWMLLRWQPRLEALAGRVLSIYRRRRAV
jgi:membrane-associated phospholipid phosphatase